MEKSGRVYLCAGEEPMEDAFWGCKLFLFPDRQWGEFCFFLAFFFCLCLVFIFSWNRSCYRIAVSQHLNTLLINVWTCKPISSTQGQHMSKTFQKYTALLYFLTKTPVVSNYHLKSLWIGTSSGKTRKRDFQCSFKSGTYSNLSLHVALIPVLDGYWLLGNLKLGMVGKMDSVQVNNGKGKLSEEARI